MTLLQVDSLSSYYGDARALHDVSLEIGDGEIIAVIGSNGAGKTTTLRTVSGLIKPHAGDISFEGMSILKMPAHRRIELGIAHVPEGRRLFPQMSVRENLLMGAYGASTWKSRRSLIDEMCDLFPRLRERIGQYAGTLSGGERQMLATARALMSRPRLLMLDEPSLGLAPKIVKTLFTIIERINGEGVAVLVVEQNVQLALKLATRAYLLENGHMIKSGETASFLQDEDIRRAYLGV
ncbi:MAG: ABC transporter ATP-binding protein [Salinisphaera sp.]|jgi:branched-chain amino acid transport system ATP-binding protein|nr:ABC transporter ATP-binding protein [Salinisphaera sp.]